MIYGHDKTIHRTGHVDVETHNGKVVAVWFRCAMLPFEQREADAERAKEMEASHQGLNDLVAVEFADKTKGQLAYEGYFKSCGGKSLISGQPLPKWEAQSEAIRNAWEAAAEAVKGA